MPMDPRDFLLRYSTRLDSPYERHFVEVVLGQVPNLDLSMVKPQVAFKDLNGGNRRMDFAILQEPHIRVAIEVDGYDKTGRGSGMTSSEFVDWLERQNALQMQGWTLLRFPNTLVRDAPARCAREIELTLEQARRAANSDGGGARSESLATELKSLKARLKATQDDAKSARSELARAIRSKEPESSIASLKRARTVAEERLAKAYRERLTEWEANELRELAAQRQSSIEKLKEERTAALEENSKMKAMSVAVAVLVVALVFLAADKDTVASRSFVAETQAATAPAGPVPQAPTPQAAAPRNEPPQKPAAAESRADSEIREVVASTRSSKYHLPSCQWAQRINTRNRSIFTSAANAAKSGYVPGGVCLDGKGPGAVDWSEATDHILTWSTIVGPVRGVRTLSRTHGRPTFVNVGRDYPDEERFVVVIWGRYLDQFPWQPERHLENKLIAVTGWVTEHKGTPQIEVDDPSMIVVRELIQPTTR